MLEKTIKSAFVIRAAQRPKSLDLVLNIAGVETS